MDRFLEQTAAHRAILYKVSRAYARTDADREDLAQEIVAQLWRSYPRYDERRPFATWMYRVALNVAISYARREGRRAERVALAEPAILELPRDPPPDERVDALYAAIDELEPLNRALVLLYLDGFPYEAIAETLGISLTNVATKLQRIKVRLRERIGEKEAGRGTR